MSPHLQAGDTIFVDRLTYPRLRPIQRGDLILFETPKFSYPRRVVALPGEVVTINNGTIYLSDRPLAIDGLELPPTYQQPPLQVPGDAYFVLDSNPDFSGEVVPRSAIQGQVAFRLWPPHRFGAIE